MARRKAAPSRSLRSLVGPLAACSASVRAFWRRARKWWPVPAVLVVAAGVAVAWPWVHKNTSEPVDLSQVFTVERGTIVASISCTGEVYAPRKAELSFDVSKVPLVEMAAIPGRQVKAGDVLARIDTTSLKRAVVQAEADLTVAQDNLDKVRNPYTALDLTGARLAVEQAQVALLDAQKSLDSLLKPNTEAAQIAVRDAATSLKSAQNALVVAQNDPNNVARLRTLEYEFKWYQNNYWAAQEKFKQGEINQQKLDWEYSNMLSAEEKLKSARTQAESALASAQNQVTKAYEAYQTASANLAKLKQDPDAAELAKAKTQVALAEYNLAKTRDSLALIEAGPKPKDVQVAQAKVDSAQAALESAKAALEASTMRAPFAGTIVSVGAAVGDLVSSGVIIVTLADLTDLRVRAIVDETDISQMQIGQEVNITFDAFPGSRLRGKVLEVPLQGKLTQNILTYDVPVSLEGAVDVSVKPGMTANLSIVAGRRQNVLRVPVMAVQRAEEGNVVRLQNTPKDAASQVQVVLGLSDGVYVEVRQGLNEGDRVLVEYQQGQQQQQAQAGTRKEVPIMPNAVPRMGR